MKATFQKLIPTPSQLRTCLVTFLSAFAIQSSLAKDPFEIFSKYDDSNTRFVDYQNYSDLLEKLSTETGGRTAIYYSAMQPQVVAVLNSYTSNLAKLNVSELSRNEQLAYWINLRNLLIIETIALERPRGSIESLRGTPSAPGKAWLQKRIRVLDTDLSIHDIEKNILLRYFADPDLVYGLYQGSRGGPQLPRQAFSGRTIQQQLRELGEAFVNGRRNVKVRSGDAQIPQVYLWYADSLFENPDSSIIEHIKELAKPKLRDRLSKVASVSAQRFSYSADEAQIRLPSAGPGYNSTYDGGGGGNDVYQGGS